MPPIPKLDRTKCRSLRLTKAGSYVIALQLGILAGCSPHPQNASVAAPETTKIEAANESPEQKLYNQVTSGTDQYNDALDSIETAEQTAKQLEKEAGGTASGGFKKLVTLLDDAGSILSDYSDDPPAFDQFNKEFAAQDEHRLKAIKAGIDVLQALDDAGDVADELSAGAPPAFKQDMSKVTDAVDDASGSVEDGVKQMGGKLE